MDLNQELKGKLSIDEENISPNALELLTRTDHKSESGLLKAI